VVGRACAVTKWVVGRGIHALCLVADRLTPRSVCHKKVLCCEGETQRQTLPRADGGTKLSPAPRCAYVDPKSGGVFRSLAMGDGTTTATVLTRAIFAEGCKSVAAGGASPLSQTLNLNPKPWAGLVRFPPQPQPFLSRKV